jgi:hypothetical protein
MSSKLKEVEVLKNHYMISYECYEQNEDRFLPRWIRSPFSTIKELNDELNTLCQQQQNRIRLGLPLYYQNLLIHTEETLDINVDDKNISLREYFYGELYQKYRNSFLKEKVSSK